MNLNKLTAVYGRVSSSNQENEGTIETQISAVMGYANENGLSVVKRYLDEGWSGDSIIRPGLDQLRVDAKKGGWEAVLIYDPDRLARRYSYQELVMDELREAGIEVIFVTTPAPKNGVEKILYGVQGLFAEYERAKIAERFRLGKVRKAKEGHVITTEAPYGYTFILKNGKKGDIDFKQGYYLINDEEAEIVRDMFQWVAEEGLTLRAIVRRLKEKEIKPRKSLRGVWNTSTLSTLFRNKTYIGKGHYGASYATIPLNPRKKEGYKKIKKTSRKLKPEEEWIVIPTPKLISEEIFYKVQDRLKYNFTFSNRNKKNDYLLAGVVWCTCGQRRAGEGPQNGKHLYYRCTDRVKKFPLPSYCKVKSLNARIVDGLVWNKLSELMSSKYLLVKHAEHWLNSQKSDNDTIEIKTEDVKKEISKLKEQESRYMKAYGVEAIDLIQLKLLLEPIKERIMVLTKQISLIKEKTPKVDETILLNPKVIEDFACKSMLVMKDLNFKTKRAIIKNVIERVVGTREEIKIYGSIPIGNVNEQTNDRNCRAAKRR